MRLLRKPERIETMALLPDHPPVSFSWRGVRRRARRADGPERILANGGSVTLSVLLCAIIFASKTSRASASGFSGQAMANIRKTGTQSWFLHGIFG